MFHNITVLLYFDQINAAFKHWKNLLNPWPLSSSVYQYMIVLALLDLVGLPCHRSPEQSSHSSPTVDGTE